MIVRSLDQPGSARGRPPSPEAWNSRPSLTCVRAEPWDGFFNAGFAKSIVDRFPDDKEEPVVARPSNIAPDPVIGSSASLAHALRI